MNAITKVTRRNIFDIIRDSFYGGSTHIYIGRLTEVEFLSRLYDHKILLSTNTQYKDSYEEVCSHRCFDGLLDFSVFGSSRLNIATGDDETLLRFLCEIFHPEVRIEEQPWKRILDAFNLLLKEDGYEIYEHDKISGRSVYHWREIASNRESES